MRKSAFSSAQIDSSSSSSTIWPRRTSSVPSWLRIAPPSVALGQREYPQGIGDKLRARLKNVRVVDGLELAEAAGNARTVNTVLLGALSNTLEPSHEQWIAAIMSLVPERFQEVNLKAFELGRQAG